MSGTKAWNGRRRETPEVWPETMVCPHCLGRGTSCHMCAGTHRLTVDMTIKACGSIWAKWGCHCAACDAILSGYTKPRRTE